MWWTQSAPPVGVELVCKNGGGGANAPSVPSVPPALSNDLQRHMLAALPSNVQDEFKNLSPYVKVTNIQSIISFLTFYEKNECQLFVELPCTIWVPFLKSMTKRNYALNVGNL